MASEFIKALDKASQNVLSDQPLRKHLGPSASSDRCARKVWYSFRQVYKEQHTGRMMRLFNRGHEEEHRIVRWLRAMDVEVRDYAKRLGYHEGSDSYVTIDWDVDISDAGPDACEDVSEDPVHLQAAARRGEGPKQWGFKLDIGQEAEPQEYPDSGHYGGSCDGKVRGLEHWFPQAVGWGLLENKTHNEKSFKALQEKGVLTAKPEHYNQMQQYMHFLELPWALYIGVNKNDDAIYAEIVPYRIEVAQFYADRAQFLVETRTAPPRITEDPSWFQCRFCAFREICHYGEQPQKSCFSCAYAVPVAGGQWECQRFRQIIPDGFLPKGCDAWEPVQ